MLNIALCDDIPLLREILQIYINEYGNIHNISFNICHFDSGEELLDKYIKKEHFFDLYFLDYYMKDLTGLETALEIRKYDKKCSIVFVTSANILIGLQSANPMRILLKPVEEGDIFSILDEFLSNP